MECTVDRTALLKIVLHAAKYATTAVNGVLIGTVSNPASGQGPAVHVYDAIPLLHNFITLTPMLECALIQAAAHAKQQKGGVRIVGYYQCNERYEDSELSGAGKKIADRLEQLYPDSVALVLDSAALQRCLEGREEAPPVLGLFVKDGPRGWVSGSAASKKAQLACPTGGLRGLVVQYTNEGRHRKLADFEDHLDDIARDWLNEGLLD